MPKRDQLRLLERPLNLRGLGGIERRGCTFLGRKFGLTASESEECLVERWTAQADVVDFDLSFHKEPERACQLLGPPIGCDGDGPCIEIGTRRLRGDEPDDLLDCWE